MRIGIISDIHGIFPKAVSILLSHVDEIWCLGDIWTPDIYEQILAIGKPVQAVYGNWEEERDSPLLKTLKGTLVFEREGLKILLSHKNFGQQYKYNKLGIDLHCYGHIHRFSKGVEYKRKDGKPTYLLNPGAITPMYEDTSSFVMLDINDGKISNCQRSKMTCDQIERKGEGIAAIFDEKPSTWWMGMMFENMTKICIISNDEKDFAGLKAEYSKKLVCGNADATHIEFFYNESMKRLFGGIFLKIIDDTAKIKGYFIDREKDQYISKMSEELPQSLKKIFGKEMKIEIETYTAKGGFASGNSKIPNID